MDKYEYSDKRICKHNIQRETCRECLFEVLCHLEEEGKDIQKTDDSTTKDLQKNM